MARRPVGAILCAHPAGLSVRPAPRHRGPGKARLRRRPSWPALVGRVTTSRRLHGLAGCAALLPPYGATSSVTRARCALMGPLEHGEWTAEKSEGWHTRSLWRLSLGHARESHSCARDADGKRQGRRVAFRANRTLTRRCAPPSPDGRGETSPRPHRNGLFGHGRPKSAAPGFAFSLLRASCPPPCGPAAPSSHVPNVRVAPFSWRRKRKGLARQRRAKPLLNVIPPMLRIARLHARWG